jgi:hypothetical protein
MVVDTPSPNILSASQLLAHGWQLHLGCPDGSSLSVPGCPHTFPITTDTRGNYWLSFTPVLGDAPPPTVELLDPASPIARLGYRITCLIDTGAEHSVFPQSSMISLSHHNSIPVITLNGVAGSTIVPTQTGILRIRPPPGAIRPPPPTPADAPPTVPNVLHYSLSGTFGPTTADVLRTRAATFPALRSISTIAERLNLKDGAAYRAFRNASPFGIADDAPRPKDDTAPIDQEYFVTGAGRKPSIFHSRPPLSIAIRNHMPPGSVWFTDISLQRPPDHQGNCYSRLFAEEHCGYASTY